MSAKNQGGDGKTRTYKAPPIKTDANGNKYVTLRKKKVLLSTILAKLNKERKRLGVELIKSITKGNLKSMLLELCKEDLLQSEVAIAKTKKKKEKKPLVKEAKLPVPKSKTLVVLDTTTEKKIKKVKKEMKDVETQVDEVVKAVDKLPDSGLESKNQERTSVEEERKNVFKETGVTSQQQKEEAGIGFGQDGGMITDDNEALMTHQIDTIMKKYPNYKGTIAKDQLSTLVDTVTKQSRGGAIVNLDNSNQSGSHWTGLFWDGRPNGSNSIEYYDSFGRQPPDVIMNGMKKLNKVLQPDQYLKIKVNGKAKQDKNSVACGYHSISFIMDRFRGKGFSQATGFDCIDKNEQKMEMLQDKFEYML